MAVHVVQSGDTWASIALAHDVVQAALCNANNADASTALYPGQVLAVPAPKPKAVKAVTKKVDDAEVVDGR